jgi:hypothetical protein
MRYILMVFTVGALLIFAGITSLLCESLHSKDSERSSARTHARRQVSRHLAEARALKLIAVGIIIVLLSARVIEALTPPH